MSSPTKRQLRPIDWCVLEAERKRARMNRTRQKIRPMVQLVCRALVAGGLLFAAIIVPFAVILGSASHSYEWMFGIPIIFLASLILGVVLAGNLTSDETRAHNTATAGQPLPQSSISALRSSRDEQPTESTQTAA